MRPDVIDINDDVVVIKKRGINLVSTNEIIIPKRKIAGIKIRRHLLYADIEVIGYSSKVIGYLEAFSYADAKTIKEEILS